MTDQISMLTSAEKPLKKLSLLLDNSTYFSFKHLVLEEKLDANSIYNAANFLESIVLSDSITMAPTIAWHPDASDVLFKDGNVCSQYPVDSLTDKQLIQIFRDAVEASISDLFVRQTRNYLRISDKSLPVTRDTLLGWKNEIIENPRQFLYTYSGAVFLTDSGSRHFVSKFTTDVTEDSPASRHIAQYLLRTNVALELLDIGQTTTLAYHPHSNRAAFVFSKMAQNGRSSISMAKTVLREAELTIKKQLQGKKEQSLLSRFGAFRETETDMPLVLSVVLSGATEPGQLIDRALELRNMRAAKRYRAWISNLLGVISSGDQEKELQASAELDHARQLLSDELVALYGIKKSKIVERTASFAGAIDLEKLAELNMRGLVLKAASSFISGSSSIADALTEFKVKRKIALITSLAKQRRSILNLNALIEHVFGKPLSLLEQDQLSKIVGI